MNAYALRKFVEARAGLPVYDSPTDRAAADHARSWRPDTRLARGSAHTKTRPAHQMCSGDGQCGNKSGEHCGGRYWAVRSNITFCKGDASLKIALGKKRQARIRERGW